jgi:hypothetical protein
LTAASRGRAVTVVLLTSMIGAAAAACTAGSAPAPSSTLGPVPDDVATHLSVEVMHVPAGTDEPVPDAAPSATITLALGQGEAQGPATDLVVDDVADTAGHLARNHAVDCARAAVESGVQLSVETGLPVELRDGEPTALVTVRVEPVHGGPEVTIDRITETTLMANPDAGGGVSGWAGRELDGQRSGEIILPVVPARCDAHAVGEDKRGTFLPVEASVGGAAQHVFYLPMPDAARAGLYGFIGDSCGWAASE